MLAKVRMPIGRIGIHMENRRQNILNETKLTKGECRYMYNYKPESDVKTDGSENTMSGM